MKHGKTALTALAAAVLFLPLLIVVLFLGTAGTGSPAAAAGTAAAGASAPAVAAVPSGARTQGGTPDSNKQLGAELAAARGWTGTQDTCLDDLWTRESGWRADAINPSSGAYGIAQALGHLTGEEAPPAAGQLALNRMGDNYPSAEAAGNPAPWGESDPAAQITWGLDYIAAAYQTPCGAWNQEETDGFY